MLKRFTPVADCSNEFSGRQLQPQRMPIGQVVTRHNGLSPLNCPSLPEVEAWNGDFPLTLLDSFYARDGGFYFTGLFFYVCVCVSVWRREK
jgi:hypothetical protein